MMMQKSVSGFSECSLFESIDISGPAAFRDIFKRLSPTPMLCVCVISQLNSYSAPESTTIDCSTPHRRNGSTEMQEVEIIILP